MPLPSFDILNAAGQSGSESSGISILMAKGSSSESVRQASQISRQPLGLRLADEAAQPIERLVRPR